MAPHRRFRLDGNAIWLSHLRQKGALPGALFWSVGTAKAGFSMLIGKLYTYQRARRDQECEKHRGMICSTAIRNDGHDQCAVATYPWALAISFDFDYSHLHVFLRLYRLLFMRWSCGYSGHNHSFMILLVMWMNKCFKSMTVVTALATLGWDLKSTGG